MTDLEGQVITCAAALKKAFLLSENKPSRSVLPGKCYEEWGKVANLHASLMNALPLFEARRKALEVMEKLVSPERISREGSLKNETLVDEYGPPDFSFDGIPMNFPLARHLATTGYICATWSLYDRLANVCGRIVSSNDIPDNPWQDPKLWANLMGGGNKPLGGFLIQKPLANAYGWPTEVAYRIRNWFVHDGGDIGRGNLFHETHPSNTNGFKLHKDALDKLQKDCSYSVEDGRIRRCCLSASEDPWPRGDLLEILEKYHREIDTMFSCLVKWSVDSLVGQVTLFSERDKHNFSAVAAATQENS